MNEINPIPPGRYGHGFISKKYLPEGKDEYYIRNLQNNKPADYWRRLFSEEIETLVKNFNSCDDWNDILVRDPFSPKLIRNSIFVGMIRIGTLEPLILEHHSLEVPVGITGSLVLSCDIGDNCAIHNVDYLAHYIIGDSCILLNNNEMHTTDHAKFGNGIVKQGEDENVRIWLELMNEAGGREVMPFDGMIPADAFIWLRYREDAELQKKLKEMTQNRFDARRGYYGIIGDYCVIKNNGIIKDVNIGSCCYVKGSNKLKNLTINSSEEEPTQIGEGVELVNGIVGYDCRVFYGCKAVRFIMGRNSSLKYGARLIHSFLGDNSTVSCCEILHNLIFPAHEQHHNNSFLTSSCIQGQSNIAAGATIGSNHNSRANDGEILAGRGFWPGLCVTLKHSCRFASFTLISKGDYPAEMDMPLPFSLLSDSRSRDQLEIIPAYWWMYNMYALARNSWKFKNRDTRKIKIQKVEFEALAPDTAEEIFRALGLLEVWTAKAFLRSQGENPDSKNERELSAIGKRLFAGSIEDVEKIEVRGENIESSKRKVIILKPLKAYRAYKDMLFYYAMKNVIEYMNVHKPVYFTNAAKALDYEREMSWVSLGGLLVTEKDVAMLIENIKTGKLSTWNDVHRVYDTLDESYRLAKQKHSFATLKTLLDGRPLSSDAWKECLDRVVDVQEYIRDQVYLSRKKDYENPIRKSTFRNDEEMRAVVGTPETNSFIKQVRQETEDFKKLVDEIKKQG
jgi:hypothetical protein